MRYFQMGLDILFSGHTFCDMMLAATYTGRRTTFLPFVNLVYDYSTTLHGFIVALRSNANSDLYSCFIPSLEDEGWSGLRMVLTDNLMGRVGEYRRRMDRPWLSDGTFAFRSLRL